MMFSSIRVKLTLWYICVLAVILGAFAIVSYELFVSVLQDETNTNISEMAQNVEASIKGEQNDGAKDRSPDLMVKEALDEFRFRDYQFAVFTHDNKLTATTMEKDLPAEVLTVVRKEKFGATSINNEPFHFIEQPFRVKDHNYKLFVFYSLADQIALESRIRNIFLIASPLLLLFAGFGGYFLARQSLRPIATMSDRAKRISAANLHERLPIANKNDEIGNLALVFNALLDRLDVEFERKRRFMADASHELRTPLAIVRGESEVVLSKDTRTTKEYQESLRIINDESKRLTTIVDDLFTLARADSGELKANFREMYLDELLADCVRSVRTLADKRNITIEIEGSETLIKADESLLRRLFLNLLDNAVKYNVDGGSIEVKVADNEVSISNTGAEIPAEKLQSIFDRFFRADKSHSHNDFSLMSGAGLGLSIAKTIADLHNANIKISRTNEGENIFSVSFNKS